VQIRGALFAGGRILGAAPRQAVVPARDADIATDAFEDLVLSAIVDLRLGRAETESAMEGLAPTDQIEDAAANCEDLLRGG